MLYEEKRTYMNFRLNIEIEPFWIYCSKLTKTQGNLDSKLFGLSSGAY